MLQKKMERERSAEREVAEWERIVGYRNRLERGAAFSPLTCSASDDPDRRSVDIT